MTDAGYDCLIDIVREPLVRGIFIINIIPGGATQWRTVDGVVGCRHVVRERRRKRRGALLNDEGVEQRSLLEILEGELGGISVDSLLHENLRIQLRAVVVRENRLVAEVEDLLFRQGFALSRATVRLGAKHAGVSPVRRWRW